MSTQVTAQRLLGVVLCGGKSSRMGRDKALLPHSGGGRFIDHAISQLSAVCDEVCVAGAANADIGNIDVAFLRDDVAFQGPITGILSALQYASENNFLACFVTPIDMPWLTSQELCRLRESWLTQRNLVCGISDTDRLQPLVAVYPTTTMPALTLLAKSNDRSLSRWLDTQPHDTVPLSSDSSRNVNRPDDLAE